MGGRGTDLCDGSVNGRKSEWSSKDSQGWTMWGHRVERSDPGIRRCEGKVDGDDFGEQVEGREGSAMVSRPIATRPQNCERSVNGTLLWETR